MNGNFTSKYGQPVKQNQWRAKKDSARIRTSNNSKLDFKWTWKQIEQEINAEMHMNGTLNVVDFAWSIVLHIFISDRLAEMQALSDRIIHHSP